MARIRSIKPEMPQSESLGRVSREARLLFIMLFTICDDAGRTRAASRLLASLLYPYDDDAPGLIPVWLGELEKEGCIRRYEVDGSHYLEIPKWLEHQKIDRPSASKLPSPREPSSKPREPSPSDQGEEGIKEGKGEEAEGAAATVPAVPRESDQAFAAYQRAAEHHGWPNPQFMNSTRRYHLDARLAECGGLAGWSSALDAAGRANFLKTTDGRWQPWFDLDWVLKAEKCARLMEGRYAERHADPKEARSLSAGLAGLAEAGSR